MDALWRVIERNVQNYADNAAIYYPAEDQTYSWNQLYQGSLELAERLKLSGAEPNHKIGLLASNRPEFVFGFLAAMALGSVIVPINVRLTAREIPGILEDAEASLLLFEKGLSTKVQELNDLAIRTVQIELKFNENSDIPSTNLKENPSFNNVQTTDSSAGGNIAEILYTSGTTGKPKGVMLTHESILSDHGI